MTPGRNPKGTSRAPRVMDAVPRIGSAEGDSTEKRAEVRTGTELGKGGVVPPEGLEPSTR